MKFSDFELNALGEIGNISVGGAANSLSVFVNKLVTISIPDTKITTMDELKNSFQPSIVFTQIDYSEGLKGSNFLLMKKEEAFQFVNIILKEKLNQELTEWDEYAKGVLAEIFNIMVGNMSCEMSVMFKKNIKIHTPNVYEKKASEWVPKENEGAVVAIWFEVRLNNEFTFKIVKVVDFDQAKQMIQMLKEANDL